MRHRAVVHRDHSNPRSRRPARKSSAAPTIEVNVQRGPGSDSPEELQLPRASTPTVDPLAVSN